MTTAPHTATPALGAPGEQSASRARSATVALVGGSVALVLARALTNNGGTPAQRLEQVTGHQAQLTVSALLAVAGFAALIPGLLSVAARIRARGSVLASAGAAVTVAGCVGFAVLAAVDGPPTVAATRVGDAAVMAEYLHQLDETPALAVLGPVAVLGFLAGPFLVALAAWRARLAASWVPWLVLAGVLLQPVGLVLAGPGVTKRLLDVACQLVLLIALGVLARTALLSPDRS